MPAGSTSLHLPRVHSSNNLQDFLLPPFSHVVSWQLHIGHIFIDKFASNHRRKEQLESSVYFLWLYLSTLKASQYLSLRSGFHEIMWWKMRSRSKFRNKAQTILYYRERERKKRPSADWFLGRAQLTGPLWLQRIAIFNLHQEGQVHMCWSLKYEYDVEYHELHMIILYDYTISLYYMIIYIYICVYIIIYIYMYNMYK